MRNPNLTSFWNPSTFKPTIQTPPTWTTTNPTLLTVHVPSVNYESENSPNPYDPSYPSARHNGRRSAFRPMSTTHPPTVQYDPFSLGCSYRRPTVPSQRCGGYSSGYPCCSGEHTRKYEPMVERPHREPYGMCGGAKAVWL